MDEVTQDRDNCQRSIIEEDCYRVRGLRDVRTVIDVGACYGTFIRHVRTLWPHCTVHAFEPTPFHSYGLIDGDREKIHIHRHAVSDRAKRMLFAIGNAPSCSAIDGCRDIPRGIAETITVECVSLQAFIDEHLPGATIDILKIDCEGSEVDVLRTLKPETLRRIRYICGEYHTNRLAHAVQTMLEPTHHVELQRVRLRRGLFFGTLIP